MINKSSINDDNKSTHNNKNNTKKSKNVIICNEVLFESNLICLKDNVIIGNFYLYYLIRLNFLIIIVLYFLSHL